jgi:hypothetical protein
MEETGRSMSEPQKKETPPKKQPEESKGGQSSPKKPQWLIERFPDPLLHLSHVNIVQASRTEDCIFVLDTNTILTPFSASRDSVEEVGRVFKKLSSKGKLLLPAHCLREFLNIRGSKIRETFDSLKSLKQRLNSIQKPTLHAPVLDSHSSFKALNDSGKKLIEAKELALKHLADLEHSLTAWDWSDPVSNLYREVFTKASVVEYELEEGFPKELEKRYQEKRPPGFNDEGKPDGGAGDLIIWKTLLKIGTERRTAIVFVTNDTKDDWWVSVRDNSMVTPLLPRDELIAEFQQATGQRFGLMTFPNFLKHNSANEQVVSEIEAVEASSMVESLPKVTLMDKYTDAASRLSYRITFRLNSLLDEKDEVDQILNLLADLGNFMDTLAACSSLYENRKEFDSLVRYGRKCMTLLRKDLMQPNILGVGRITVETKDNLRRLNRKLPMSFSAA